MTVPHAAGDHLPGPRLLAWTRRFKHCTPRPPHQMLHTSPLGNGTDPDTSTMGREYVSSRCRLSQWAREWPVPGVGSARPPESICTARRTLCTRHPPQSLNGTSRERHHEMNRIPPVAHSRHGRPVPRPDAGARSHTDRHGDVSHIRHGLHAADELLERAHRGNGRFSIRRRGSRQLVHGHVHADGRAGGSGYADSRGATRFRRRDRRSLHTGFQAHPVERHG